MEYAWTECTVPEALHLYHQAQRMCADAVKLAESSGEVIYGLQVRSAYQLRATSFDCAGETKPCRSRSEEPLARENAGFSKTDTTISLSA